MYKQISILYQGHNAKTNDDITHKYISYQLEAQKCGSDAVPLKCFVH